MNAWINNELYKIDQRTEEIIQEFEKIERKVSPETFYKLYKPALDILKSCYSGSRSDICDSQDHCYRIINSYYEN